MGALWINVTCSVLTPGVEMVLLICILDVSNPAIFTDVSLS